MRAKNYDELSIIKILHKNGSTLQWHDSPRFLPILIPPASHRTSQGFKGPLPISQGLTLPEAAEKQKKQKPTKTAKHKGSDFLSLYVL